MEEARTIRCKVKVSALFCVGSGDRNKMKAKCTEEGEFAIGKFKIKKTIEGEPKTDKSNNITLKGDMPSISPNCIYTVLAKEVSDVKYGLQYDVLFMTEDIDLNSVEDQKKFLGRVLTQSQVSRLFSAFGNPLKIIEQGDIESLSKVKGIGSHTAFKILDKYEKTKDNSKIYVMLDKYDLSNKMIDKLIKEYKSPEAVINKLKKFPYELANEVAGIGFAMADKIALKSGISKNSPKRIASYIIHTLESEAQRGNSYIWQQDLMQGILDELCEGDYTEDTLGSIKEAIYKLKDSNILWWDEDKTKIALKKYLTLEKNIAEQVKRILNCENKFTYTNWEESIKKIEIEQGWTHTDEQKDGIKQVLDSQLCVVTGLSGTGKTSITNAVTEVLDSYIIKQCALAGRASQRIAEVTGREASTIHKLLGYKPPFSWEYDESNKLEGDVFIIDEASMIGGDLFLRLLKAIPDGAKVIIIGDYGQLSSIGVCNVFYDLLESNSVPIVKLEKIHRQAQSSAIISKSIEIRNQNQIVDKDYEGREILGELQDLELDMRRNKEKIPELIEEHFMEALKKVKSINEVQVIVPMTERGQISTYEINKRLQAMYNKAMFNGRRRRIGKDKFYTIYEGDKVINVKNNYKTVDEDGKKTPIFNGSIGTVKNYDPISDIMTVDFIGVGEIVLNSEAINNLELSYAITCNKYQGSQSDHVIVALDYSAYMLLTCEWVYTATTRAQKYAVLIAETKALRHATRTVDTKNKRTFLLQFLQD